MKQTLLPDASHGAVAATEPMIDRRDTSTAATTGMQRRVMLGIFYTYFMDGAPCVKGRSRILPKNICPPKAYARPACMLQSS
jgi:hypothetical protein